MWSIETLTVETDVSVHLFVALGCNKNVTATLTDYDAKKSIVIAHDQIKHIQPLGYVGPKDFSDFLDRYYGRERFGDEGICIPYPQRAYQVYSEIEDVVCEPLDGIARGFYKVLFPVDRFFSVWALAGTFTNIWAVICDVIKDYSADRIEEIVRTRRIELETNDTVVSDSGYRVVITLSQKLAKYIERYWTLMLRSRSTGTPLQV